MLLITLLSISILQNKNIYLNTHTHIQNIRSGELDFFLNGDRNLNLVPTAMMCYCVFQHFAANEQNKQNFHNLHNEL